MANPLLVPSHDDLLLERKKRTLHSSVVLTRMTRRLKYYHGSLATLLIGSPRKITNFGSRPVSRFGNKKIARFSSGSADRAGVGKIGREKFVTALTPLKLLHALLAQLRATNPNDLLIQVEKELQAIKSWFVVFYKSKRNTQPLV